MAHELTLNAQTGKYEMAFVGELPWHGLGQQVRQGCTIEEMRAAAGLEWSAMESVEQYAVPGNARTFGDFQVRQQFFYNGLLYIKTTDSTARILGCEFATEDEFDNRIPVNGIRMRQNDARKVLYRSDTGAVVGAVGSGYKVVQPAEILEFFREFTESGDWHIHTAGSLKGGSKIWAMASNHTEGQVIEGDTVKGNLLLSTSLDGTMKTTAAMTAVRVVCANTLKLALGEYTNRHGTVKTGDKKANGKRDVIAISHRSHFDADAVKSELDCGRKAFNAFIETGAELAHTPMQFEQAREILRTLFGQPLKVKKDAAVADAEAMAREALSKAMQGSSVAKLVSVPASVKADEIKREQKSVIRCLELFEGAGMGADHIGSKGTAWGLLNAVTQHIDHDRGRTADSRIDSAFFGVGADVKTQCLELLAA